jgi:ABC-2 type transport system ATP-binding protein
VVYFGALKGLRTSEARARGRQILERFGVDPSLRRTVDKLSKGMAQKVQLAAAIVSAPRLLLLDEPFSGLDPVNQGVLEEEILRLRAAGATVLFSTHVMQHAERLCDQVVLMAHGRKVFDGTVDAARSTTPRNLILEGQFDPASLRDLPGVQSLDVARLEIGGVRVTAALAPGAPAQAALRSAFTKGLDISRFEMREPNLHDAFIVLTGGKVTIQ